MRLKIIALVTILIVLAPSVQAKVHIIGDLPTSNLLLPHLLNQHNWQPEQQDSLILIHKTWLEPIYEYLQKPTKYSALAPNHPIHYFSQQDANEILVPLLKTGYNFELTSDQIQQFFPIQADIPIDANDNNSIQRLKREQTKAATFACAQKIATHAKGNIIISIGQTPAYLVAMLRVINATLPSQQQMEIIEIAYSGKPDLVRTNRAPATWQFAFKHILTPTREVFFRNYLRTKNIFPERFASNTRVYLLDFSSGQGISHFLFLLAKWFKEYDRKLPDMIFMNMVAKEDIYLSKHGTRQPLPLIDDLDFKISDNLTIGINTFYLDLPYEILLSFANLDNNVRVIPPFHAATWQPGVYAALSAEYPTPIAKNLLNIYRDYAANKCYGSSTDK